MKLVILIVSILFFFYGNCTVRASLKITKYDPLSFQLTFSQPIALPSFQILVDSITLPYIVLNNSTQSSEYQIEVTQNYQSLDTDNTESFSLIFNYPLQVANGQLYVSNYVLSPAKADLYIAMSTWPVYLVYGLLCVCSSFCVISLAVIDFIQIYVLTEMKFYNKTSVIETYRALFFFDHYEDETDSRTYLMRLMKPTIILLVFFLIGVFAKFISRFIKNNLLKKRIVKFFAYDIFLSVWTIFLPSVIFKAIQFSYDAMHKRLHMTNQQYALGFIFAHLNYVNFVTYFYVLYFVINPKINQENESFRNYLMSSEFQLYSKLHRGLHLSDFVKRNTMFFISLRKFIVVLLFFFVNNISPIVLTLQMIACFFIFTLRPYKEWYYTNIFIAFNLLWFFFYIIVLEGFFYFNISNILETRLSLSKYLISKSVLFHIICFLGFMASAVEAYRLFKNLKYEFKEDRDSKVNTSPVKTTRGRLYTETSDKMIMDMKESLIFDSPNSPDRRTKKREPSNSSNDKGKINLFEVQMEEFSPARVNRNLSTRIKKKWKDRSLLEQLATN